MPLTSAPKTKSISASAIMRGWWFLLRLLGAKSLVWNSQYRRGLWLADYAPRSAPLLDLIAGRCGGGRLVELGCGEGSLPRQLPAGSFSVYHGIDISTVAVERARAEISKSRVAEICTFECADIARWEGDRDLDLIVAEECLYYLPSSQLRGLLARCAASLLPEHGRLIAVVHSEVKHAATLDVIRECLSVETETQIGGRRYVIARPPACGT